MKRAFCQQRDQAAKGENAHNSFCRRPELRLSSQANEVWLLRAITAFGAVRALGESCISPTVEA